MDKQQQTRLYQRWQAGDRWAFELLVESFRGFIVNQARRCYIPSYTLEDKIQVGLLACIEALRLHDPVQGAHVWGWTCHYVDRAFWMEKRRLLGQKTINGKQRLANRVASEIPLPTKDEALTELLGYSEGPESPVLSRLTVEKVLDLMARDEDERRYLISRMDGLRGIEIQKRNGWDLHYLTRVQDRVKNQARSKKRQKLVFALLEGGA